MDFKRKLGFLPTPSTPPVNVPAPLPAAPVGSDIIEQLRAKMAEILDKPRYQEAPRPPADPSQTILPFAREESPNGPVYRRHLVLPPSHHVGRIPVDSARNSRAELLALLALDPGLAGLDLSRALFLDTETSGLGGTGAIAFLLGLAWFDAEGRLNVEQLLLRSPADEPAQLDILSERLAQCQLLVSYNGKAFDWPLLKTRYVMNRREIPRDLPHLDLLHIGRRLHRARLGACRLKTLESEVLGFERGEDVDGGDVPARYSHFLRTGDEEALAQVVEHNCWDVVSMAALVGLYGEPFDLMHGDDLVGFASTMKRAGALAVAERAADRALELGASAALRVRGAVHKARGDRTRALHDFESLAQDVDDPALRLELAKLYEHFVKDPARALELLERGTGESDPATEKRRQRLQRKAKKPP
ncbi:MAG TPA: ribonuclease H-like domain-containing protein [Polyangiaceae bacterium]|nr:ribonuclease H-like domain-containing protein [Polyangiaceae bacterium]